MTIAANATMLTMPNADPGTANTGDLKTSSEVHSIPCKGLSLTET